MATPENNEPLAEMIGKIDTWSAPNQDRIKTFLATAAIRLDELDGVDL